jgi:hypothetical protein
MDIRTCRPVNHRFTDWPKLVDFEPNRSDELEYFGGLDGLGLTVMTSLYNIIHH